MSTDQGEIPAPEGTEIQKKVLISNKTGQQYNIHFWVDGDGDSKVKKKGDEKVEKLFKLIQDAINE
jgi:hypothetical protein